MVELKGRAGTLWTTRRIKMRIAFVIGLVFALAGAAFGQSRVVVVFDTNSVVGTTIDTTVVKIMMNAGIKALTDSGSVGGAWRSCFPGLTGSQNIALKINTINTALPSHPQVATAILRGLVQMPVGATTFRPWRLMLYDDRSESNITGSGFTLNPNTSNVLDTTRMRCRGNSRWGYQAKTYNIVGSSERFASAFTDSSTFLINHCVLKDHSVGNAEYTITMKNHFGSVNAAGMMNHSDGRQQIPQLNRYIRDSLNRRERVYVLDALFAIYNGGPGGSPQAIPRIIVLSKDPVACDSMGVEMINNLRRAHGLQPKNSRYLAYAESIGLGTRRYTLIRINNPSMAVAREPGVEGRSGDFALLAPRPNPFAGTTEIPFLLPRAGEASVEVYNTLGERVRTLARGVRSAGPHRMVWDGRDDAQRKVSSGVYLIRLSFGGASIERTASLIR
jgi:hypothetical protein